MNNKRFAISFLVVGCLLAGFWQLMKYRAYSERIAEYREQLRKDRSSQLRPWEEKMNLSPAQIVVFERILAEHDEELLKAGLEKQLDKAKLMIRNADERANEQVHAMLHPDQIVVFDELVKKSKSDAQEFQERWKKTH